MLFTSLLFAIAAPAPNAETSTKPQGEVPNTLEKRSTPDPKSLHAHGRNKPHPHGQKHPHNPAGKPGQHPIQKRSIPGEQRLQKRMYGMGMMGGMGMGGPMMGGMGMRGMGMGMPPMMGGYYGY
eukprot:NODE_467_length_7071_cov_0.830752.p8 type:complete len:124 gc:universal NODE_467_length_7071_cov_0.830752:4364-4735(+)